VIIGSRGVFFDRCDKRFSGEFVYRVSEKHRLRHLPLRPARGIIRHGVLKSVTDFSWLAE
jgi:hypothetical protein